MMSILLNEQPLQAQVCNLFYPWSSGSLILLWTCQKILRILVWRISGIIINIEKKSLISKSYANVLDKIR